MGCHTVASASPRHRRARPRPRDSRVQTPQTFGIPENSTLEPGIQKRPVTARTPLRAPPDPLSGRALEQAPASEISPPPAQPRVTLGLNQLSGPEPIRPRPAPTASALEFGSHARSK